MWISNGMWTTSCGVWRYKQRALCLHNDDCFQTRTAHSVSSRSFHAVDSYKLLVGDGSWDTLSHSASYRGIIQSQQCTGSWSPVQQTSRLLIRHGLLTPAIQFYIYIYYENCTRSTKHWVTLSFRYTKVLHQTTGLTPRLINAKTKVMLSFWCYTRDNTESPL